MRNLKSMMLLVMTVSLITFTGCKSDDDGGDGGNAADGTITAKVDGTTVTSLDLTTVANLVSATNTLTLQGNDADGRGFVFVLNGYDGEGTYDIGGGAIIAVTASYLEVDINDPMNTQTWSAPFDTTVAGQISISSQTSDNIQGTFNFTGQNANDMSMKSITEGSFNVSLMTL